MGNITGKVLVEFIPHISHKTVIIGFIKCFGVYNIQRHNVGAIEETAHERSIHTVCLPVLFSSFGTYHPLTLILGPEPEIHVICNDSLPP